MKIYVDVGCRKNPGPYEIQIVDENGHQIYYREFKLWSNNIGEYLAIYFGFKFWIGNETVYSDSITALAWVRKGCNTKMSMDYESMQLVKEADQYFKKFKPWNRLQFWNTKKQGENPADFWRK